MRRVAALVLSLGLSCALAASALAQCDEPSALDVRPTAEPLRVTKSAGGGLVLAWEDVGATGYHVNRGHLDVLWDEQRYDHVTFMQPVTADIDVPLPAGNRYFLVSGDCADPSVGRDSDGDERPRSGLARLTVAVAGGADVFGVHVSVLHPPDTALAEGDMVAFVGPFVPGSPGNPMGSVGEAVRGTIDGLVTFTEFTPDPSFDPPVGGSTAVMTFDFGWFGAPPTLAELVVDECDVQNEVPAPVAGATCDATIDVLF